MLVQKLTLQGSKVRLEPLSAHHLPGLAAAIDDGELWKLPVTFVPHPADLAAFLEDAEAGFVRGEELGFAMIDIATGRIAGSTRFLRTDAANRTVEIGFTFLGARWQRTHVNTEAKYLMLKHAFDTWGCNRVELFTDVLNTRSRTAIARLGARQEGVLRSHLVMRDGRVRDSVLFSMIRSEWPAAEAALTARLRSRHPPRQP